MAKAKERNFKNNVYSVGQKKLFTNAMKNPEMANIMKPSEKMKSIENIYNNSSSHPNNAFLLKNAWVRTSSAGKKSLNNNVNKKTKSASITP